MGRIPIILNNNATLPTTFTGFTSFISDKKPTATNLSKVENTKRLNT